jgi:hypothetical protein
MAQRRLLHGDLEDSRHLFRVRHHLAIVTTFTEQLLRMGLLEIAAADLAAGDVGGDRQDRPAATGAHGQSSRQVRLSPGGKCSRLFVSHRSPPDIVPFADGVRDAVEGVPATP